MTKAEYLKLVQNSAAFKGMDQETQARILNAQGADRESYENIFTDEENEMLAAKKDLITTTERLVQQFDQDVKVFVTTERRTAAAKAETKDGAEAENLLSQINNL